MIHVNVCLEGAEDWLFGDLKRGFLKHGLPGVRVTATETPLADANAWIFIRTSEAATSPDLRRTVVCIHDVYNHETSYQPGGDRAAVRGAAGLVLCHPEQRRILRNEGIELPAAVLERPLGALEAFTVRDKPSDSFTAAWVGRSHPRKRPEWFVDALRQLRKKSGAVKAILIGMDLQELRSDVQAVGVDCAHYDRADLTIEDYPPIYRNTDCVVITSSTEAGPLPLFESLASGVPVISTPVGWSPILADCNPDCVLLATDPSSIATRMEQVRFKRGEYFRRRFEMARIVEYRLETWFPEVLQLAISLPGVRGQA